MKSAVIVFPGSNCDRDLKVAIETVTGRSPDMVWHKDSELPVRDWPDRHPGGFSYGDYLAIRRHGRAVAGHAGGCRSRRPRRAGAGHLQRFPGPHRSRPSARRADAQRGPELRLAARRPDRRKRAEPVHRPLSPGRSIAIPVAHHDGNYQADPETLDRLEGEGRVAFRYSERVNGSARQIAGIINDAGNVLGMMPHPERALEAAHGNTDGRRLFEGLLETVA
jgi:phosphoribosylformylglycinamidine synthase